MPIFPQYGGISTNIAVQTNPNAPSDPRPAQIQGIGRSTEQLGTVFAVAEKKKRELLEEADVTDRATKAVADMESIHEQITQSRENSLNAKDYFDHQYTQVEPDWYKGLSPRAQNLLQHKLYGRTLEYRIGASKIGNRAAIQEVRGALDRSGQAYTDIESRRINPDDASSSSEYTNFLDLGNAAVARNAMTPEEWADKQKTTLANGAYSRAHKIIASENTEEIKHFLDIVKDSKEAGSQEQDKTFLRNIKPDQRNTLEQMAQQRIESLRAHAVALKNQEWTDTHRQLEEMQKRTKVVASLKLSNPEKYGTLTRDWVEMAGETGMLQGDELIHYRTQAEALARSGTAQTGGYGNPAVINRYSIDVFSTKSPEQALALRSKLLADINSGNVPSGPGSVGSQYLAHLTQLAEPKLAEMTPRQQTERVKEMLKAGLRVSGPGAQMLGAVEQSVMHEALEAIDKNAIAGYPKAPIDIYNENIDKWQARIGGPGQQRAGELARSQGLGYTTKGDNEKTFVDHASQLKQQFDAAPPGPEGEAIRTAIRDAARQLRRLQELDAELKKFQGLKGQAKSQREQQKQESSGPLTGPRK